MSEAKHKKPEHNPPTCDVCGSILSVVTWTCNAGKNCKPRKCEPSTGSEGK